MTNYRKKTTKRRSHISDEFYREKITRDLRQYLATEHFYIFYMFYSDQIESGEKSIQDFKNLSMSKVNEEIRLRTLFLRKKIKQIELRRQYRKDKKAKDEKKRQIALMERLKTETNIIKLS